MKPHFSFLYIQKLVILSADRQSVLLAQRKGEADYNEVYSFIGGKMETTDTSLIAGMKREKDEEIGPNTVVKMFANESYNLLFRKSNGDTAVLPHIAGFFVSGDIELSDEYSAYKWVPIAELAAFEPKIENIPEMVDWAVTKLASASDGQLVEI